MEYLVRQAREADIQAAEQIYAYARQFMADHGNPDQWNNGYPSEELLCQDIARERLFLIYDEAGIHGVFYFGIEEDPTYAVIREGNWRWDKPYGVIHRIAGDGSGGILQAALRFACRQANYLRIDTHEKNYVIQRALEKQGFHRCGWIFLEDGSPRIAYDQVFE